MLQEATDRALKFIAICSDARKLKQVAENAKAHGAAEVEQAALRRLYAVMPVAEPGTLEHDVWQSVYALEGALKAERGKTTLLSRTRQKLKRDGEVVTVADLVTGKASAGFQMLLDRHMPELTFEAVALRHPQRFSPDILAAAEKRLEDAGVNRGAYSGVKRTC
jgi:hypothetical protein